MNDPAYVRWCQRVCEWRGRKGVDRPSLAVLLLRMRDLGIKARAPEDFILWTDELLHRAARGIPDA